MNGLFLYICIYLHIRAWVYILENTPPFPSRESTDDNGVKNMKRGRENEGKCKIKRKRRTEKGRKGKKTRKWEVKG
jgi:hypothetical protein